MNRSWIFSFVGAGALLLAGSASDAHAFEFLNRMFGGYGHHGYGDGCCAADAGCGCEAAVEDSCCAPADCGCEADCCAPRCHRKWCHGGLFRKLFHHHRGCGGCADSCCDAPVECGCGG
jgi:hypothetical protein